MTAAASSSASTNPYVGPNPIQYGQPIYGRDLEISEVRDTLLSKRVVLFYAPSGAGKSSLVEAGLRPQLEALDFDVLPTIRVGHDVDARFGNRYQLSALQSLEERSPGNARSVDELAEISLGRYLAELAASTDTAKDPCLIFDQFEELFTLDPTDVASKSEFLGQLGRALRDRSWWCLIAMREDYIARLDPYLSLFPARLATRIRLDLLGREAAISVARRTALDRGVDFTEGASAQLVDNVRSVRVRRGEEVAVERGPYVEPVVLQVVCQRLWERVDLTTGVIDVSDIDDLGDIDDSLADFCDSQLSRAEAASGVSQQRIRDWLERNLVGEQGFRKQVLHGPGDQAPEVLRSLEDGHFLRSETRRGTNWYEIAHDRLVGPLLASNTRWREANLNPAQEQADRWFERGKPTGLLLRDDVLQEARQWADTRSTEVRQVDNEFLDASTAHEERLAVRRRRLTAGVVGTLAALLLGTVGALWVAISSWIDAEEASDLDARRVEESTDLLQESQAALVVASRQLSALAIQLETAGEDGLAEFASDAGRSATEASEGLADDVSEEVAAEADRRVEDALEQMAPSGEADVVLVYTGDVDGCGLFLDVTIGDQSARPTSNSFTMTGVPVGPQEYRISGTIECPTLGFCTATGSGAVDVSEGADLFVTWINDLPGQCQVSLV